MTLRDWDEHYATGEVPWDTDEPEACLVQLVARGVVPAGARVIDIGCGTGTHALWLADQGFDVLGCDLSPLAIERARAKLSASKARCRFLQHDFLKDDLAEEPFELAFDRGVFHVFDEADERARFAERVAALLSPSGIWASMIGSTEGPPRDHGPPRRSLRDVAEAVEPCLEISELRRVEFVADIPSPAAAWFLLARARETPAQPSTRRE